MGLCDRDVDLDELVECVLRSTEAPAGLEKRCPTSCARTVLASAVLRRLPGEAGPSCRFSKSLRLIGLVPRDMELLRETDMSRRGSGIGRDAATVPERQRCWSCMTARSLTL